MTSLWNWAIERVAYRPLRGSFRLAPLISAIGMSIFLSNMGPGGAGSAQQDHPADVRATSSTSDPRSGFDVTHVLQADRHHGDRRSVLLGGLLVPGAENPARAGATGLRAGPAHGGTCSASTSTSHDLVDLRDRRRAWRPSRACSTSAIMGWFPSRTGSCPGSRPLRRPCWAASARFPARCWAACTIGLIEVFWSSFVSTDYKDVAAFSILAITLIFIAQLACSVGPRSRRCDVRC